MKKQPLFRFTLGAALVMGYPVLAGAAECGDPCTVTSASIPELRLIDTTAGATSWELEIQSDGIFEIGENSGPGIFKIQDGANTNGLVISNVGNVGINTDSPQSFNELEVAGNLGSSDQFAAVAISPGGAGEPGVRMAASIASNALQFGVKDSAAGGYNTPVAIDLNATNNAMTISSSNRIGIGGLTTSQISGSAFLHVEGFGATSGNVLLDATGSSDDWLIDPGNAGLWLRNGSTTSSTAPVKFGSSAPVNSLVMAGMSGDIGLGTSAPARQLHLVGSNATFRMDRSANTAAFFMNRTNASGAILKGFQVGANAYGTNNGEFIISDMGTASGGPGTRRMTIDNSGDVVFTGELSAVSVTETSSKHLKDNIKPFANALDTVKKLQGVRFDWKESGKSSIGVIAEDVEKVLPELVTRDDTGGKIAGVQYSKLVAVFIEATKEQQKQIEAQQEAISKYETRVAEQKAEMDALRAQVSTLSAAQAKATALESRLSAIEEMVGTVRLKTASLRP